MAYGVSIKYKNSEITKMEQDGEIKLLTKNKYLEDDVDVTVDGSPTLISKNITANGSYSASDDSADGYEDVTVNVPNTYAAGDEGKVVSNGALVAQTSATKTENGTYDTTLNNEVVVNVQGSSPTLVSKTITENGVYDPADDNADGYDEVTVNVSGGSSKNIFSGVSAPSASLGSDGDIYLQYEYEGEQITDISDFTKLYSTSIPFGSYGTKVNTNLDLTNESTIASNMNGGWNASASAYYDSENQIGAYGGYDFGEGLYITKAKFWLGRFSGQNKDLTVTIEYLDGNGNWNEIEDFTVSTALPYPANVFEVGIRRSVYGIRWIHKKTPNKSSGNTITFFGMSVYKSTGAKGDIYDAYCKVNGTWQNLIGTNIDDVNTGV